MKQVFPVSITAAIIFNSGIKLDDVLLNKLDISQIQITADFFKYFFELYKRKYICSLMYALITGN